MTLTVYYNGACPICRREIEHYQRLCQRESAPLAWVDISREPLVLAPRGGDSLSARRRLHAVDAAGTLHAGVAAFAELWARLPRYRWLARLLRRPGPRALAERLYEGLLAPALFRFNTWRGRCECAEEA